MIVVLTGGTGGAKFVQGLKQVAPARELACIVNTGDDLRWWGLHVSPDVDSITYALAGLLSRERGWGVEGDTFQCLEAMRRLGAPAWFQLGDRDLALHISRTEKLAAGKTLSQATAEIARAQIWQWIRHPDGKLKDGRRVSLPLFRELMREEMAQIREEVGAQHFESVPYALASRLLDEITANDEFTEFLTLVAYPYLD